MTVENWNQRARKIRQLELPICTEERSLVGNPLTNILFAPCETLIKKPRKYTNKEREYRRIYKKEYKRLGPIGLR